MFLYLVSFLGGILTILAPCVLPVLPVILSGSLADGSNSWKRPLIITTSLAVSITTFTIALKTSTRFIMISPYVWKVIAGGIIIAFALTILFPATWSKIAHLLKLEQGSQQALQSAGTRQGTVGQIALGFSLGPVFASCSPTYALIIAVVLPISFTQAIINIAIYAIGLAVTMFAIAVFGRSVIKKAGIVAKPNSLFKKILGVILLIVGIAIITGYDKVLESKIISAGYTGVTSFEETLTNSLRDSIRN